MKLTGYLRFKGDSGLSKQGVAKRRRQQRIQTSREQERAPTRPKRTRLKPVVRQPVRLEDFDDEFP